MQVTLNFLDPSCLENHEVPIWGSFHSTSHRAAFRCQCDCRRSQCDCRRSQCDCRRSLPYFQHAVRPRTAPSSSSFISFVALKYLSASVFHLYLPGTAPRPNGMNKTKHRVGQKQPKQPKQVVRGEGTDGDSLPAPLRNRAGCHTLVAEL